MNNTIEIDWGIVLLAAGASIRLGRPKQLLLFKGETLLGRSVTTATNSEAKKVVIVLGANAEELAKEIKRPEIAVFQNQQWEEGMASSIRNGVKKLLEIEPGTTAIICMACDQPFVSTILLNELVRKYRDTGKPIVASAYGDTCGIPALFDKTIFPLLLNLQGDTGAKSVIKDNPAFVTIVDFPLGNIDIDSDADYETLQLQKFK